jgi:dolichol-phosphate mannosyltransferase
MDIAPQVAVVIPAYNVGGHVLSVIEAIGPEVHRIYVVDDCCPQMSGDVVHVKCTDPRVTVIRNAANLGVGGAVMAGYKAAMEAGMDIIVKVDGDGQMDPRLIPDFISPIVAGEADYTKGNRFYDMERLSSMPKGRLFGNAVLSLVTKLTSGYWNVFDPTNGYTAIHGDVVRHLPLHKISERYFFETDMLFRLNTLRAVVVDVPMQSRYAGETSSLRIPDVAGEFAIKSLRNFCKRIFYNYYLRDMSLASIELPLGLALLTFGLVFGAWSWIGASSRGMVATPGTVMLAALPMILGLQFVLAFIGQDIRSVPTRTFHRPRWKAVG